MTRLSVSRPTWSVPNRLWASGGLFMRRKSAFSGSRGASHGAAMATKMMKSPTAPPRAASRLRRAKRTSSPPTSRIADPPCAPARALGSAVANAGVEPGIAEVHEHVHHDEDDGVEQHEVLDDDDVALDHGGDE